MTPYEKLYSNDCRNDIDDNSLEDIDDQQRQRSSGYPGWRLYFLLICFSNTASFLAGKYWPLTQLQHLQALTTWCKEHYFAIPIHKLTPRCAAPLHAYLPYNLHSDHLEATTWSSNPSLWRAEPSIEGDKLWEQAWDTRPILIPFKDADKLGLDSSYMARWLDDPDMIMVGSQAHHLLHCVDVLRKAVWTDHYWPKGNLNPGHRTHQTHCVDLIRQDIMCRAPMDVYPLIWMQYESQPTPNFNISMKCGDWDHMLQWWRERQMTGQQVDRIFVKPEGVKQWIAPPGLKEENDALKEICSRPNVSCTARGDPVRLDLIEK